MARSRPSQRRTKPKKHDTPKAGRSDDSELPPRPAHFRLTGRHQQRHRKPLYSLCWSVDIHEDSHGKKFQYLAVCGHNVLSIYEVEMEKPRGVFEIRQTYRDKDKAEQFYACAYAGRSRYIGRARKRKETNSKQNSSDGFQGASTNASSDEESDSDSSLALSSSDGSQGGGGNKRRSQESLLIDQDVFAETNYLNNQEGAPSITAASSFKGPQLLCTAGCGCIIKVIDTVQKRQIASLRGHGNDVFDLKTSPVDENLLLSASVDESIRLWNLRSFACVAIFAGQNGHNESVLCLSWHMDGERFASSGRDESVRLWSLHDGKVPQALRASNKLNPNQKRVSFHPACQHFPYFASKKIHRNVVDCVQFLGDLILSKSTYNSIVLWTPILPDDNPPTCAVGASAYEAPSDIIALRTFDLFECHLWFVRFATDDIGRLLAVGTIDGEVDIWDIDTCQKERSQRLKAVTRSTVRTLSFSPDGKMLVTCSDNGQVSKWNEW